MEEEKLVCEECNGDYVLSRYYIHMDEDKPVIVERFSRNRVESDDQFYKEHENDKVCMDCKRIIHIPN